LCCIKHAPHRIILEIKLPVLQRINEILYKVLRKKCPSRRRIVKNDSVLTTKGGKETRAQKRAQLKYEED
jgi:hypothetical protein